MFGHPSRAQGEGSMTQQPPPGAARQAGAVTLDALQAETARLAAIVATAPTVVHSFHLATDGRMWFELGSERVADLFGVTEQEVRTDARAVFARRVDAADDAATGALAMQSARDLVPWRAEYRVEHPERGQRWVEGHSMPSRSADGGIVWYGALTDITERKHTEQALRDSQAQLKAVFHNMTEGLVVSTPHGVLFDWNPTALRMHGFDERSDVRIDTRAAEKLFEMRTLAGAPVPPDQWPLPRTLRGEALRQHEVRLRRLDQGWEKVFSYSTSRIDDAQGNPHLVVVQISDVTARRQAEDEVVRLNADLERRVAERTAELQVAVKELEAFSYSVSHDLRAPLRALDGFSQALIEDHGAALPDDGRRYLGIIRQTAQKMGRLIDDLLDFSRLNRQPLTRRSVDNAKLVRHAWDSLAAQREDRNIELRIGELPACEADLALLRQVWVNLLANAIKYSRRRDPAVIEVGSAQMDGAAEYFVRDNGAGFDMRYVHKLFGVFERLHRAEEFEGTGVGLAIVRRIVERHGGSVRAEGATERGASFFFTLGPAEGGRR
jgi:signal transduction histidine kinase